MATEIPTTIADARTRLDAGDLTARELTEAYLTRSAEQNAELNAYLEVFEESAREDAQRADAAIEAGSTTALTGIPLAIKDNILVKDKIASAGSRMLEQYTAVYDATVIRKLKEQHAPLVGRTNMDEFALGSSTENSAFGPTRNPHDPTRVPGGTSGGSAAAVAAGMTIAALGSDTGGSIRQPAALCGVVGFKPTYGAVSRYGLMAAASSLDQIGTLTRTVADAETLFACIRGEDPLDSTSLPNTHFQDRDVTTIGVPRAFLKTGIDADVLEVFEQNLERLRAAGYEVRDIELPSIEYSLAAYYIINPAEVSTNLARYDGVRYGLSHKGDDLVGDYLVTRGAGFGDEVVRRILTGTFVLSAGYADAYYRKAIAVRNAIRREFADVFKEVDVLATPTSPTPAFKLGEKSDDPLSMYAADLFTTPVNLTGVPALSVPMESVARDGNDLPTGMQFIAPIGTDSALFSIGAAFEKIQGS